MIEATKKIYNFTDFMNYIESYCGNGSILFRGQGIDMPLIPKLGRIHLLGDLISAEKEMIADFKRQSIPYLKSLPNSDWDWLSLAQHHGMATRLLDWTGNPLAALWFAVSKPPKKDEKGNKLNGVVWVFKLDEEDFVKPEDLKQNPFSLTRTKVFQPSHISNRITNQSGWFTVHKFMKESKKFIKLETNKNYKKKLCKLIILNDIFEEMRFFLDKCNINSSTLFADLDGVCRNIEWKYSYLSDE